MKKIVKKNVKILIGFVLGIIVSGIGVYAATSIGSSQVSYDNTKSGMSATTMQGAIDELYKKTKKECKVVEGDKTVVGSTVNCEGEIFYISTVGETTTLIAKNGLNSTYKQSITPTAVNYSDATDYIENYVNTTLSWLKGNMSFYGLTTKEEVIKLSTGAASGRYIGDKLEIGGWYWLGSKTIFVDSGPGYEVVSSQNDATSATVYIYTKDIYARPMIIINSNTIS